MKYPNKILVFYMGDWDKFFGMRNLATAHPRGRSFSLSIFSWSFKILVSWLLSLYSTDFPLLNLQSSESERVAQIVYLFPLELPYTALYRNKAEKSLNLEILIPNYKTFSRYWNGYGFSRFLTVTKSRPWRSLESSDRMRKCEKIKKNAQSCFENR